VGWGPWSDFRSFSTLVAVPGMIGGRAFSSITATSAVESWTAPSDGGGTIDIVQHVLKIPPSDTWVRDVTDNASPMTWGALTRKTGYTTQSRAHNEAGWGPWNTALAFTTLATAPSAPAAGTPVVLDYQSIRLPWAAPTDNGGEPITGYRAEVARDSAFTVGKQAATVAATAREHTFTGLLGGTLHYLRVYAINAVGEKSSSVVSATTETPIVDPAEPPAVSNVTAVSFALRSISGTYTRNWQVATDIGFTSVIKDFTSAAEQTTVATEPVAGTLYARYRLDSGAGYGAFSDPATVQVPRRPVRWDGAKWVDDIRYWNGAGWVFPSGDLKRWNGTGWD
jgi:titin